MNLLVQCNDCGSEEVIAVWPGQEGQSSDLFQLTPSYPAKGWCERCWQKRYSPDPAPPRSGGRVKTKPFNQD